VFVQVATVRQSGEWIAPGLLPEPCGVLARLSGFEHRLAGASLRLALLGDELAVGSVECLVHQKSALEFAARAVQFGLFLEELHTDLG
jgi:hypothetical protein